MNFLVLVKAVPIIGEPQISGNSVDIDTERVNFFMDEIDTYALEEAVLKKEKLGGTVTVVTIAERRLEGEIEKMIWECYAKGADNGYFIMTDAPYLDPYSKSAILSQFVKNGSYDLILMGVQSSDTGSSLLGPLLAKKLGLPCGTSMMQLEILENKAKVELEMEEGYSEILEYPLPALFTVQSGINTPRYPPFIKIKTAKATPINKVEVSTLNANPEELVKIHRQKLYRPETSGGAKMLEGDPSAISKQLAEIIKSLGVL